MILKEIIMTKFEKNVIKSIGGKKVQIVIYMLEHTNNENIFFGTYTEIAKANEATIKTVQTNIIFHYFKIKKKPNL